MHHDLAPIVLFAYNRPEHTRLTLEALMANKLADQSVLFIYCDGPKSNSDAKDNELIQQVRNIVRSKQWCKEIFICERNHNFGLAKSIIDGVTEIIQKYGKIIVLEDDILTSPYFLQYMNTALTYYENIEEVACISGYMFPVEIDYPEYFFLKTGACWGWGSWDRAWKILSHDINKMINEIVNQNMVCHFDFNHSYPYFDLLQNELSGLKSWAIRWYASIYLSNKLTLYPNISLTKNIGFDGTGTNCGVDNTFYFQETSQSFRDFEFHKLGLFENKDIRYKIAKYNRREKKSIFSFFKYFNCLRAKRLFLTN